MITQTQCFCCKPLLRIETNRCRKGIKCRTFFMESIETHIQAKQQSIGFAAFSFQMSMDASESKLRPHIIICILRAWKERRGWHKFKSVLSVHTDWSLVHHHFINVEVVRCLFAQMLRREKDCIEKVCLCEYLRFVCKRETQFVFASLEEPIANLVFLFVFVMNFPYRYFESEFIYFLYEKWTLFSSFITRPRRRPYLDEYLNHNYSEL